MIIKLVGSGEGLASLETRVRQSLAELSLDDSVTIETTDDALYKMELGITANPALTIEEESIDFRDMIFQGEVPEYDEIKSMFLSILGDDESEMTGGSCGPGGCGSCETGCAS